MFEILCRYISRFESWKRSQEEVGYNDVTQLVKNTILISCAIAELIVILKFEGMTNLNAIEHEMHYNR